MRVLNTTNTPIMLNAKSPCGAAITVHREQLWCLWVDQNYSIQSRVFLDDNRGWGQQGSRPAESTALVPALASFEGELHAVFVSNDRNRYLLHITGNGSTWSHSSGSDILGKSQSGPSLAVHNGKLYLAFTDVNANTLRYSYYDPDTNKWTTGFTTNEHSWGEPALAEIRGELHLLFAENDANRQIVDLIYDDNSSDPNNAWHRNQRPDEHSAGGVAATGFGAYGYLLFQENNNNDLPLLLSTYLSQWTYSKGIGELAYDVPAVTVFRDKLSVVFIAKNSSRSLLWRELDLADPGDPEWMKAIPGITDRQLRELCFPGTHDSGTYQLYDDFVSENVLYGIPTEVVTLHNLVSGGPGPIGDIDRFIDSLVEDMSIAQELTLSEQLYWGVRSIDLRVCAMNGGYFTFHGFRGNSLQTLLDDIAWFLSITSNEIVWLWLSPRGMTDAQRTEVRAIVTAKLEPYCFLVTSDKEPSANLAAYTVGQVLAAGQLVGKSRVIIVDDSLGETGQKGSAIWAKPDDIRYSAYSNSSTIDTMLAEEEPGQGWAYQNWRSKKTTVPTFELCMTLTPQTDDINGELVRRLRDANIPDSILETLLPKAGLPWPPPPARFTSLHQLSQRATQALGQYDQQYHDRQFNFISLDFINETNVMQIAKRRCGGTPS